MPGGKTRGLDVLAARLRARARPADRILQARSPTGTDIQQVSIRSFSVALTVALLASAFAQGQADRVQWLRANAIALPDAASDADLAPIRGALDGVDVIFL